jgi:hypothetical protein
MTYVFGDVPVGAYDSTRLANIGVGHGAIDAGGGYTYFAPESVVARDVLVRPYTVRRPTVACPPSTGLANVYAGRAKPRLAFALMHFWSVRLHLQFYQSIDPVSEWH